MNEFLSKLIKEAEKKIEVSKKNAVAAGNFYVNGVCIFEDFMRKSFPKPKTFWLNLYPRGMAAFLLFRDLRISRKKGI